LSQAFSSCDTGDNDNVIYPGNGNVSIIGKWQMYGSTQYGLEFTNNDIVVWIHKPYMNSNLNYTYSETNLTVNGVNGTGTFSNDGNTLKISGFCDPGSFGKEGATGPFLNGTYIRQ
jgi:hypothetical protein